jgi:hypothetical protein
VASPEKIGEWDTSQLSKFVQTFLENNDLISTVKKSYDELVVGRKLTINDEQQFMQTQKTVGSAGGASAPPATPETYAKVLDATGSVRLIPLYRIS